MHLEPSRHRPGRKEPAAIWQLSWKEGGRLSDYIGPACRIPQSQRQTAPPSTCQWNVILAVCLSTPGTKHTVQMSPSQPLRMDGWPERDTARGRREKPLSLQDPKMAPKEDLRRPQKSFQGRADVPLCGTQLSPESGLGSRPEYLISPV